MADLRNEILRGVLHTRVSACIVADEEGIVADTYFAGGEAGRLGLDVNLVLGVGVAVRPGEHVLEFAGSPRQVAVAEEILIGIMAKPSGIATATHRFVERAGSRPDIVCGAWKKMPPALKESIRGAVVVGGARFRICDEPFVYLDKTYIEMLGGIRSSLEAVSKLSDYVKVIQLKGKYGGIAEEALEAVECGASILSIDTGDTSDIEKVSGALNIRGVRDRVRVAFAGGIRLEDIDALKALDVDIVDVGREIVDAPLLDMRMEVLGIDAP